MGNKLSGIKLVFHDSNWKNSLAVVTTNVDAEVGADGNLVINSPVNGTDVVGRSTREVKGVISLEEFNQDILEWNEKADRIWYEINTEVPFCRYFLDGLFYLNLALLILNIFLYGKLTKVSF